MSFFMSWWPKESCIYINIFKLSLGYSYTEKLLTESWGKTILCRLYFQNYIHLKKICIHPCFTFGIIKTCKWVPSNILPADGLTKYNRNYMLFYCDSTISSCTLALFCKQICYFVNILLFFVFTYLYTI